MKKFVVLALTAMLISTGSYLKAQSQEEADKLKEKAAELVTEIKTLVLSGEYAQANAKVTEFAKVISGIQEILQDMETGTPETVIEATAKPLEVPREVYDITGKPTIKQDELFIDEDGDGINDLYLSKEGKRFGFKHYEKAENRIKRYRIEKKREGEGR